MVLPIIPTACFSVDPHGLILQGGGEGQREGREELELEGRRRGRRGEGRRNREGRGYRWMKKSKACI